MTEYIKKPHTALFIPQIACGKTHLVLDLIEKEYKKHFDYIVFICPTLRENNETYHAREWIKNDDKVWLVDFTKDNLCQCFKKLSELLRFLEVLFIIHDIIANESLEKKRQFLLELSISGRHRGPMAIHPILHCHTKRFTKTAQGYFCVVSKGTRRSQGNTRGK